MVGNRQSVFYLQLLLAASATLFTATNGVSFGRVSVPVKARPFGVNSDAVVTVPRGGADESKETEEPTEPETLYLPGLLDAELTKSGQVSYG